MKSGLLLYILLMIGTGSFCQKRSREIQFDIGFGKGSMNLSQSLAFQNADTSFANMTSYNVGVGCFILGASFELSQSIKIGLQLQQCAGSDNTGNQASYTNFNSSFYGLHGEWFKNNKNNNEKRHSVGVVLGYNNFLLSENQAITGYSAQDNYKGFAGKVYASYMQYFGHSPIGFFLRAEARWSKLNLFEAKLNKVRLDISNIEASLKENYFMLQAGLVFRIRTWK
jgi:hypothetical protein